MDKYKKLLGNSLIFTVGNFGSKIISVIMVPLYTYVLTPSDYGTVDLITTTTNLLLPLISLSVGEAVIRYVLIDSDKFTDDNVLHNALIINSISSLLIVLLYPILSYFFIDKIQVLLFLILLISNQYQVTLSQYARGISKIKEYAINGILMTIVVAGLNIVFLVNYSLGVYGYILSLIFSNFFSILYLFIICEISHSLKKIKFNKELSKSMLVYSLPLVPNMIMWWLINGSTRYFILFFKGAAENGIFAVANKIPAMLSILTSIFQSAWQLSAFEEFDKKNDNFFSVVFNYYFQFSTIVTSLVLFAIKDIIIIILDEQYYSSWTVAPFLLIGVLYQSLSGFIGTNYTANMKTKGVFTTSVVGAIISLICNFAFIPKFGIIGASIATAISFFCMFGYRYIDTKSIVFLNLSKKIFFLNNLVIVLQVFMLFFVESRVYYYSISTFVVSIMIFANWRNRYTRL